MSSTKNVPPLMPTYTSLWYRKYLFIKQFRSKCLSIPTENYQKSYYSLNFWNPVIKELQNLDFFTKTIAKNLSPVWNETFKIKASSDHMQQLLHGDPRYSVIDIVIFDDDKLNKDDALGTVSLPLNFNDHPTKSYN